MSDEQRHGYKHDPAAWSATQADALRRHAYNELDLENIADEIEQLGLSDKHEIYSRLVVVVSHMLKWQFQPTQRSPSWRASIREGRYRIARLIRVLPLAGKLPSPMPRRSVRRSSRPRRGRNWNSKSAPPMPVADRTSPRPRVLATRRLTLTAPSSRVSLHSFAPAPFTTIGGPSGPQSKSGTSAIDSSPTAAQNSSSTLPAGASTHPFSARRWRANPSARSGPKIRRCP